MVRRLPAKVVALGTCAVAGAPLAPRAFLDLVTGIGVAGTDLDALT